MKTSGILLYSTLCLMLFSACNKEGIIPTKSVEETQISYRGNPEVCGTDFITNGDFQLADLQCGGFKGVSAFENGCVDDWFCYFQTADLISPFWNWSDIFPGLVSWSNYSFDSNMAFMCTSETSHNEMIYQDLALPLNNDKRFCLSFDYGRTSPGTSINNNRIFVKVGLGKFDFFPGCSNPEINNGLNETVEIFPSQTVGSFSSHNIYFDNNTVVNGLTFRAESFNIPTLPIPPTDGIFIDNVSITCSSLFVNGIDFINNGNCKFDFSINTDPNFGGTAAINWDFGDGNTGGGENPSHQYANTGMYTVTATVLDNQGCCTTVTRIIDCNSSLACDYFICWATNNGDPNGNSMQGFEEVEGFTVIDPVSGNSVDHFFSQPYDIVGNFQNIFNEFKSILVTQYNINPDNIISDDPALGCLKGNTVMPVFLVENSPVVISYFFGTEMVGGSIQDLSVQFNFFNCQ